LTSPSDQRGRVLRLPPRDHHGASGKGNLPCQQSAPAVPLGVFSWRIEGTRPLDVQRAAFDPERRSVRDDNGAQAPRRNINPHFASFRLCVVSLIRGSTAGRRHKVEARGAGRSEGGDRATQELAHATSFTVSQ
jgi:hypothetical protein